MAVKNVTPKHEYTMTGLSSNRVVQKAVIDFTGKYLYALQLRTEDPSSDSLLSRVSIADSNESTGIKPSGSTIDFSVGESMILEEFGHGETLEQFLPKGADYFWVATGANVDPVNGTDWARQIGLIQFQAGQTLNYRNAMRLSSISSANKNGDSFAKLLRCDAALSSNGSRLIIMGQSVKSSDSKYTWQLTCYDTAKIVPFMESFHTLNTPCTEKTIKNACVSAYNFTQHLPWDSQQGLEFNDSNKVYISGGHQKSDNPQRETQRPHILKGDWRFTPGNYETVQLNINDSQHNPDLVETEGLQLHGDNVYVGIEDHAQYPATHMIYSFAKNEFSV
ncbi:helveticin J family class III bacteriocin [Lentilactobacillus parakefiri]|uniref:Bacteriocin n=1 Tax=Lentilactobacillus parakefiri TaxID=152332 RepID=A0A269Y0F8_9LACO|nr:helveticin J family class III bacteriocin [Lentilactobacillus parakefiri]PAK78136.1 hypothetical protein B8W98_10135 [Lentilactobacillus parakefiri]PAK99571.1 hypothetical protein B8W96_10970 [Lentilactobacillus parakefiri]TDG94351.1 hypothetical protein C5L28_001196 [Lentilactobacillus parakefiri]GAW71427.1 bacteriocin [Lentilactobacillus parakefiri]